jgi:prepilin-type N-terminal cleavage/methylation domain-containing protein
VQPRRVLSPEGTADKEVGKRNLSRPFGTHAAAFSLIEMLVVMAVIAILASMIFPITKAVSRNRIKSRIRAEMEQVATAIEVYKTKRGHYPPDNHLRNGLPNPYINQLYYELAGTSNWVTSGGDVHYQTSDGRSLVDTVAIKSALCPDNPAGGVSGFVNTSAAASVEEGSTVVNCLKGSLRADQLAQTPAGFKLLVGSVPLPFTPALHTPPPYPGAAQVDPNSTTWYCAWRYNSSSPTNNTSSFDLWIDLIINGKTNRFSNWSRDAVIVNSP